MGSEKVKATAAACCLLNPTVNVQMHAERFRRSSLKSMPGLDDPSVQPIVFCCVDSIITRQLIWENIRHHAAFFVDGRMSAEVIRVLASAQSASDTNYLTTLFAAEQAYAGSGTAKSTVYTATIAAVACPHSWYHPL